MAINIFIVSQRTVSREISPSNGLLQVANHPVKSLFSQKSYELEGGETSRNIIGLNEMQYKKVRHLKMRIPKLAIHT